MIPSSRRGSCAASDGEPGVIAMANIADSDKHYGRIASGLGSDVPVRGGRAFREWLHVWRWPAAVLAGVLLWLTLVAVAGATENLARGGTARAEAFAAQEAVGGCIARANTKATVSRSDRTTSSTGRVYPPTT